MKHTEQTIKCSHQSVGVFVGGCNLTSKTTTVFMSHMRVVEIKLSMRLCDADSDDNPDNDKRPLSHCLIIFFFMSFVVFSSKNTDFSCFKAVCANQSSDLTYLLTLSRILR